ncbi:hypothetical protein WDU94_005848 [Cyamophila willieti]
MSQMMIQKKMSQIVDENNNLVSSMAQMSPAAATSQVRMTSQQSVQSQMLRSPSVQSLNRTSSQQSLAQGRSSQQSVGSRVGALGGHVTEDEDEGEEEFFQDVDILQNFGINVADIKKLKSVGLCTIKGVQMTTRRKMTQIKGFSEAKVDKIKEACTKISNDNSFLTAAQVAEKRKHVFKITTGSAELDKILGGGIESMAITEAFGEFRTGKTQLSHTLSITAQLPDESKGYSGGKVIYVDSENTFRPERLRPIAARFNLEDECALENVLYTRSFNSEHQMELLDMVAGLFHQEAGIFKLLIIDSAIALFRVDFSGRGELADRQQKLAQYMARLQRLSEEFNVAVFITNQMTSDPGATMSFQADPKKPVGGNIMAHASTTRISLRKGRAETRIAKIYDSPDMPEAEAMFAITNGGVTDAKD